MSKYPHEPWKPADLKMAMIVVGSMLAAIAIVIIAAVCV